MTPPTATGSGEAPPADRTWRAQARAWFAPGTAPWWLVLAGLLCLYLPTGWDLARQIWSSEEQNQGPVVLAVVVWLAWRAWPQVDDAASSRPRPVAGWSLVAFALLMYLFGRSQRILSAQTLSAALLLPGIVLLLRGPRQLRAAWFPLFFLLFMVPLPAALVDAVTQPLKLAVSAAATHLLYLVGYPIERTGVIITIGPYQLLVADACAGLHTLFSLEAMGLLYLNVVRHASWLRNVMLAIFIVPISFTANVIRVVALALITYHLGDEAGQGFLHGFAGLVLFMTALVFIMAADSGLRWLSRRRVAANAEVSHVGR